jgi:RimJ/RimL family protein N-acetyltransferase
MKDKFPIIETERLVLRELKTTDIPKIVEYAGNPNVSKTTLNIPYPYRERDAVSWINMTQQGFVDKTYYAFAIDLKSASEFIGGTGLKMEERFNRAEAGYWIAEPFWNIGYCTEALNALLKFGFEKLNLNKIYVTYFVENPASGKVMKKTGMIQEGLLIDHYKKGDKYFSLVQHRLTRKEYEKL